MQAPTQPSIHTSIFDTPRSLARSGNEAYSNNRFAEAEEYYRASLSKDKRLTESIFNLGNSYYRQGKYDDAASQFRTLAEDARTPKDLRAQSFHNLGNTLLQAQKINESITAYKNALRLNPHDDDTRYNLAYAKRLLLQQQRQHQPQSHHNQQQEQEENKEQQNQPNNSENQKQQPQQLSQQRSMPQPKLSRADAERILEALNHEEKHVQKKLMKRKATGVVIEKDW
ncbi:MAG: tetratricopeptide repeat protein [Bacteroidota bacterium]|nr:tetratricopeptide repeat protein [Candidatus Kapabacteria bacterium]MDW8219564.1 tetratricopeptide repeat protein [Bacteroidota bacterium]